MKTTAPLFRRRAAVLATATLLHACGGGGAAPPSAPDLPPATGTPSGGGPSNPASPTTPSTPTTPGPQQPTPPAPPASPAAPSSATIETPNRTFSPATVTIALNGTVTWRAVDDDHEIRFTSAAPTGGSPGELEEGTSASRTFTATGTYDFECQRHRDKGMRGQVVVVAPAPDQPPPGNPPPSSPPPSSPPPSSPPPSGSSVTVTTPNETFSPSEVTIPTGGSVTWQFSQTRHNVTFLGASPTGGNIPDQDSGTTASRTFAVAGTYNYVCTRHSGMTGRVAVQ